MSLAFRMRTYFFAALGQTNQTRKWHFSHCPDSPMLCNKQEEKRKEKKQIDRMQTLTLTLTETLARRHCRTVLESSSYRGY